MQPQIDTAARLFHTPAFAAYYAQRLQELRARLAYVCKQAWDVNAAWLVRHDVILLQRQLTDDDSDQNLRAWQALETELDTALEQTGWPDEELLEGILAAFRRIDMEASASEVRRVVVRQSENDRIEVPPAAFWRRWVDDAEPPSYPESSEEQAESADSAHEFGFEHIDIDAVIAAGKLTTTSSMEIVQETVAPHVTAIADRPETPAIDSLDSFFSSPATGPGEVAQDDYDWGLESSDAPAADSIDADAWALDEDPAPRGVLESTAPTAQAPVPAPTPSLAAIAPAPVPDATLAPAPAEPQPPAPDPMPRPAVAPPRAPVPVPPQPAARRPSPAGARAEPVAPKLVSGAGTRIYHLTESDDLACELDQRLEQLDYELELLDNAEELKEVLGALTPNLVVVDAQFKASLPSIGKVLQVARQRSSDPIRLLVLAHADTMEARLMARRAGADSLLVDPRSSDEVIARIEQMLEAPRDDQRQRVLIVEDDRSQGLFAESILRNAGMEAEVVMDGLKVMEAMRRFQPDLVLMDLYMPDCSGVELTALIREHDEFLDTPIVFLSGEMDTDKHYEALSAGGDDFLSKPIRPKYLIATVNNRIRRAQAMARRGRQVAQPETVVSSAGLHFRTAMLERLEQALMDAEPAQRTGGVMFIGVRQVAELRQRLGLTTVEELLEDVAQFIVNHMGAEAVASRYGDGCFLIFDPVSTPDQLRLNAREIRDTIAFTPFETPREIVSIEIVVGIAELRQPFDDAAAILNAAEHDAGMRATAPVAATSAPGIPATPEPSLERRSLVSSLLTDAIERGRMDLDYQPIVALQIDAQAQYQALLRLRRDGEEDLTAAELLPVIRAQQRLPEFDRWALGRALEVAAQRLAIAKPVTLFVNQSVTTLCQPGYADWLAEELRGTGRIGGALVIEINIEEIQLDLVPVQAACSQLLEYGLRFCLSRYSGSEEQNSVLEVLPVDLVKIAPRVIAGLGNSAQRADFAALVEHLHEHSITVIAPRVEETRTAAVLWMSGIDFIQGNLVQLVGRSLDFDFNSAVL